MRGELAVEVEWDSVPLAPTSFFTLLMPTGRIDMILSSRSDGTLVALSFSGLL